MKKKILISCCTGDSWINKLVVMALLRLQQDPRYLTTIITPTWNPYEHALNRVKKDFLAAAFDYWLNIDDDNPPLRNPLDLVELDKDVIGLPTPVWNDINRKDWPVYFNALFEVDGGWKPIGGNLREGLREVDAVGSGCWLVARRVLEKSPPFKRTYNEDGLVEIGPDFGFCQEVKKLGFRVWTHFDYCCDHLNTLSLLDVQKAHFR